MGSPPQGRSLSSGLLEATTSWILDVAGASQRFRRRNVQGRRALLHEKLQVGRVFRIVEEVPPLISAYAELICCIGHQVTEMLYLRAAKKRPVL